MTMLTSLQMVHSFGEAIASVCQIQGKFWNIGSRGCMKHQLDDAHA
jgi:hypothetical protein